jgi:DNA-binding MarR family transcriptional regulator
MPIAVLRAGVMQNRAVSARGLPDGDSGALSPSEMNVWRTFRSWTESIIAGVSTELAAETDLSVADVQVLVRLGEAPAGQLGQRELAESLMWSPSRLSHQLTRMDARNLVSRSPVGTGRLMDIALTDKGRNALGPAQAAHGRAVRKHFLQNVDLDLLEALLGKYTVDRSP